MRGFTKVHFVLVRIISLIMSIVNYIAIAGAVIVAISYFTYGYAVGGILVLLIGTPLTIVFAILLGKVSRLYAQASKMDDEFLKENKGRILGWGIFFSITWAPTILFFVAALTCVILANVYINTLINNRTVGQSVQAGATNFVTGAREVWQNSKANTEVNELESLQSSLKKLAEIKDLGVITEEEYQAKRKKILKID